MSKRFAACIHGAPRRIASVSSRYMRMIAIVGVAMVWVMVVSGCSSSRPGKGAATSVNTVKTNDDKSSSTGSTDAEGLPTSKPLNEYQRMVVDEAGTWLGTPYKYAHAEKRKGTDCSGMVMMVYDKALQAKIPRNSAKQAEACMPLKPEEVEGGDLVFFATGKDKTKVSHVGIMLSDGVSFIHASSSKGVVISRLTATYYRPRILMYGRVPAMHALIEKTEKKK